MIRVKKSNQLLCKGTLPKENVHKTRDFGVCITKVQTHSFSSFVLLDIYDRYKDGTGSQRKIFELFRVEFFIWNKQKVCCFVRSLNKINEKKDHVTV